MHPSTHAYEHGTDQLLRPLLLSLADDDFMLGYRDSEWTGIAPMLEEDIAMSSVSQDEIGHARALYEISVEMGRRATSDEEYGGSPKTIAREVDALAYGREKTEYHSSWLAEHHRGDWAFTIARRYLYETADEVRLEALSGSACTPLANVLTKVRREERYHTMHLRTWLDRLAASPAARPRLLAALHSLWPDALGFWEELEGEDSLVASGAMPLSSEAMRERWLTRITAELEEHGISGPDAGLTPRTGGRRGERSPGFEEFWAEVTQVYRLHPGATW